MEGPLCVQSTGSRLMEERSGVFISEKLEISQFSRREIWPKTILIKFFLLRGCVLKPNLDREAYAKWSCPLLRCSMPFDSTLVPATTRPEINFK